MSSPPTERPVDPDELSVGALVDLVKTYAKQETVGPLRNAGRFLAFGIAGAITLGIGGALVLLGLLRLVQTEWTRSATGSLSWLAYVVVLVVCGLAIVVAVSRIDKGTLNRQPTDPGAAARADKETS